MRKLLPTAAVPYRIDTSLVVTSNSDLKGIGKENSMLTNLTRHINLPDLRNILQVKKGREKKFDAIFQCFKVFFFYYKILLVRYS